jgi:hypothetical protein
VCAWSDWGSYTSDLRVMPDAARCASRMSVFVMAGILGLTHRCFMRWHARRCDPEKFPNVCYKDRWNAESSFGPTSVGGIQLISLESCFLQFSAWPAGVDCVDALMNWRRPLHFGTQVLINTDWLSAPSSVPLSLPPILRTLSFSFWGLFECMSSLHVTYDSK